MRVLVLSWRDLKHPAAGGAEVYLEAVLKRWADLPGMHVTLFSAAVDGAPAEEVVDGYRVVRQGGRLGVYRAARRWWRENGRGRYDVIIEADNTVPFLAHEWVDDGTPTVALVHQTCEEIWKWNAPWPASVLGRRVLEPRWMRRLASAPVLAVSDSTRDSLARFGVADCVVVPEGHEESPEALAAVGIPRAEKPTVVWCGRLVEYKRPHDLLRAVRIARLSIPDLEVHMIGGGPLLDELLEAAPDGVIVHGRVDEDFKQHLMARAHVHIATSVREGWGLVVSEAAALGTPTLAYDVPGLRDSTRAAGGTLCPPDPRALAAYLVELMPTWLAAEPQPIRHGGARSWDDVAREVLAAVRDRAAVPGTGERPWRTAPATTAPVARMEAA